MVRIIGWVEVSLWTWDGSVDWKAYMALIDFVGRIVYACISE